MTPGLEPPRFGAVDVIQIASKLTIDQGTFVVGGQATNFWAWYYREREPDLHSDAPLTSQDIDYFGTFDAAKRFADAVGGEIRRPSVDDMHTPNTAVVIARINGKEVVIDFLHGILGITKRELARGVSVIGVETEVDGVPHTVEIPVLHPVLCLKSRVANMLHPAVMRRDRLARRQLEAAVVVVRRHIHEALDDGDWKEAKECLSAVFRYIRSDRYGRKARAELGVDLLSILRHFEGDIRIDPRYRERQLSGMIEGLEGR